MTFVEFVEKTSKSTLSSSEKQFIERFERAENSGEELFINYPINFGRTMAFDIIKKLR